VITRSPTRLRRGSRTSWTATSSPASPTASGSPTSQSPVEWGRSYVAFAVDTFSRHIVGSSASITLVLDALETALWRRDQEMRVTWAPQRRV
jgi:transposase InsO family protein